jgi:hypothetical protein
MMKKHYLFFAAFTIITIGCTRNQIPKPNWTLKTEDTYLTIAVTNNHPAIYELKNPRNGWNWMKGFSEMPFPEKVQIGGTSYKPDWKYKDAIVETNDGTKLTLHFISTTPNLELESIWLAKSGVGPVENLVSVKNKSGSSITFQYADVISANINLTADSSATLWLFNKGKYLAQKYQSDKPVVKTIKLASNDTISYFLTNNPGDGFVKEGNSNLPFQVFDVNSKHGLYIGYEWSFGRFKNLTGADPLTVTYKSYLWDTASVTKEDGKVFNIPAVFFGTYIGDTDDGSNKMKRWFWNHKITPTLKNNPDEPLIEYCIPGVESRVIDYYKNYPVAEWGAELGKIDIDWLDGAGEDWTKGDFKRFAYWVPDPAKWPSGMTAGDIVHSNKQKLSLYMNNTFEWADIGTQEGRDKQKNALLTRYDNWHYDYWRSDFTPEAPISYLSHEGLLEILDYLITSRPDFRYEHCAGGGLLKDFTTLQRATVFTNEDSGGSDYHRESFYSCSYMINPVQIKTDIGMNLGPHGEVPKSKNFGAAFNQPGVINDSPEWVNYALRTGFMGANMATNWCDYTPNQIEGVKKHWPLYKTKQRPILRGVKIGDVPADVYHILPIPDGVNWDGIEYFNTSLNKGSVLIFKPSDKVSDSRVVKLKGLDRMASYSLTFQDRVEQNTKMTGAELMDKGIEVKGMSGNFASEIIWIN